LVVSAGSTAVGIVLVMAAVAASFWLAGDPGR
jgi:hypothetical protein